jgi:ATP-dependent DNA helicase PIF1
MAMPHSATQPTSDALANLHAELAMIERRREEVLAQIHALAPPKPERVPPANHGKPWFKEEKALVAELFLAGKTVVEIAEMQARSRGSIRSELIRQGLIEREEGDPLPKEAPSVNPTPRAPTKPPPALSGEFARAFELLENTRENVFITGKAGTGKSTFLKLFREHSTKKIAVVAPTGVAALNVGGQTIHSFFKFKPAFMDLRNLKPYRSRVIKSLELLVIDEISMVRADVFQAIDQALKLALKNNEPFGGVQVCVIGDLFQLPPVVQRDEKQLFQQFYTTPFFFGTEAYRQGKFQTVQFNTVHRQNDGAFIQILNAIRAGTCDAIELEALNSRLNPKATPAPGTLVLTTTNALAEDINTTKLELLPSKPRLYKGVVEGEFGVAGARLPAPEELVLKKGAQVMFVKNDPEGRWVNGSIGQVVALDEESVTVTIGEETHEVTPEAWNSIIYGLSEDKSQIIEKETGSYTQLPLTLAWAITIHKSQGKTLERVIIDLGSGAFAPGQLYVALSRCKSLSGIALKQPITHHDILCDNEVVGFMSSLETYDL